jgi:hypothetical protein
MSSHIRTVVVGGFLPEKKAAAEELEGQHSSSVMDPSFSFGQGRPRCMPNLITHRVLYNLLLQKYHALTYRI